MSATRTPDSGTQSPTLHAALILYMPEGVDRAKVGQLVKAMCSLNGIVAAIELLAEPRTPSEVPE